MRIYCASMVWGMFLPATVGADVVRTVQTAGLGLNSHEVVASIVIERMFGFLAGLVFGLLSLMLFSLYSGVGAQFAVLWWLAGAALLGATVVFAASFTQSLFDLIHNHLLYRLRDRWIVQKLRYFHSTYRSYQDDKGNLALFFGLTLVEQLGPILHTWLIARSLGVDVDFFYTAAAVSLTLLVSRIPISIGGFGVYDGMFMLLMSLAGVHAAEAIAITFVGRIMETASWVPWWLVDVAGSKNFRLPRLLAERS
jgi:uncharacterized protein (TIRG00374 family)